MTAPRDEHQATLHALLAEGGADVQVDAHGCVSWTTRVEDFVWTGGTVWGRPDAATGKSPPVGHARTAPEAARLALLFGATP